MKKLNKSLILIELNEINFEMVKWYVEKYPMRLNTFRHILSWKSAITCSESAYEENEPWIQWVSVHTGLTFAEHGVFRLGDIEGTKMPQLFEIVENAGYTVGCISPMNTENRLKSPEYFIPDPWTRTTSDNSWWSTNLHKAVSQAVNDNSKSKITVESASIIGLALLCFSRFKNYTLYLKLLLTARLKPWNKALLLDLLLSDVHNSFIRSRPADLSAIFFNAGAHIQHHYILNAEPIKTQKQIFNPSWYIREDADPVFDMLNVYDQLLNSYMNRGDLNVIIATGLSQVPYDSVKYYYRLSEHKKFLEAVGVKCKNVVPRMTRDFLVEFDTEAKLVDGVNILSSLKVVGDGLRMFGDIEIRGLNAFITLTYPNEITQFTRVIVGGNSVAIDQDVVFVALKNGMHSEKGYLYLSEGVAGLAPKSGAHVKEIFNTIKRYFRIA